MALQDIEAGGDGYDDETCRNITRPMTFGMGIASSAWTVHYFSTDKNCGDMVTQVLSKRTSAPPTTNTSDKPGRPKYPLQAST